MTFHFLSSPCLKTQKFSILMFSVKGVVPKYLVLYSLTKLFIAIRDLKVGTFKELPPKFAIFEFLKIFLILFKLFKIKQLSANTQYRLTLISIVLEIGLFIFEKNHIGRIRFVLEIVFGMLSCIFLLFFHPLYAEESKKKGE